MDTARWWNRTWLEQPHFHASLLGPLELVTPGTASVVTVDQVKAWTRKGTSEEDSLLTDLAEDATRYVEREAGRALRPTSYALPMLGFWNGVLKLPKPPLISVDSIQYFDTTGTLQTCATTVYTVRIPENRPGYIERIPYQVWPVVQYRQYPVIISFTAGYKTPANVPGTYKRAIYLLVAHWYEHREAAVEGFVAPEIAHGVMSLIESESWGSYS